MDDIRNVFGAFDRAARRREIWQAIYEGENTCGSCSKWMTDACPREMRDLRGTKVGGPSCKASKCGEFAMTTFSANLIAELRAEYAQLREANHA